MNLPNKLTLSRLGLTLAFLVVLFTPFPLHETLALALFIVASLTEYYDGKIARRDKIITNFGILMDPLADKILICSSFIAFVGLRLIPAWMVGWSPGTWMICAARVLTRNIATVVRRRCGFMV